MTEIIHDEHGWHVTVGPFQTLADAAQFVALIDGVRIEPVEEWPALSVHVADTIDITTEVS